MTLEQKFHLIADCGAVLPGFAITFGCLGFVVGMIVMMFVRDW